MTDCLLFASLFATYAVLRTNTFGGPSGRELFSLPLVLKETFILLTSSFTCGLAMLAVHRRDKTQVVLWFIVTLILGLVFLGLELGEFSHLLQEGHGPQGSAFLSAYFTLVGTHGLHIAVGALMMLVLLIQVARRGLTVVTVRSLTCLSLFWHFLDVVWIFIFTLVYLLGVAT